MATNTYESYLKSQRAEADKQVAAAAAKKKETDKQALEEAQKIVDEQVALQTQPYETRLEEAPSEYQALFDRHALQEELGRQAVELRMANMGLSDSGLAASSQAALAARRMSADAEANKSLQEYVNELRTAISELEAKGEVQKDQLKLKSDQAYDEWYADTQEAAYTQADKTAKTLYEAAQAAIKAQQKNPSGTGSTGSGGTDTGSTGSGSGTDSGTGTGSVGTGTSNVGTGDTDSGLKLTAGVPQSLGKLVGTVLRDVMEQAAKSSSAQKSTAGKTNTASSKTDESKTLKAAQAAVAEIEEMDASSGGIFNSTFWGGSEDDGEDVYQDIVEEQLAELKSFRKLSREGQLQAIAVAVGRSVATTWPDFGELRSNMIRLETALDMAKKDYGWSDKEYETARALAKRTYNEQNGYA